MKLGKALPRRLPLIKVRRLPAKRIELDLKGDPFFFAGFRPGDRYLWLDYDYPRKILTQVSRCWVRGPVIVKGKDCLELYCRNYDRRGRFDGESFWYYRIGQRIFKVLLFIRKDARHRGSIEDVSEENIPRIIKTGDRWETKEIYRTGGLVREYHSLEEIDGPYIVELGNRRGRCLRWLKVSRGDEKQQELAEVFISIETGLTFLFRRYNGPGWENLTELKGAPSIRFQKRRFLRWYDSFPMRKGI